MAPGSERMRSQLQVCDREISQDSQPFVVAELSGNHNQSLDRALALVDAAAQAGAHALKIQTYTADTMTLDIAEGAFRIDDPSSLWHGRTLYDLYNEAHTPWEWHAEIFERTRSQGMIPFSTPFDNTAVDFLETLDAPLYKIASFEVTDTPLIRRVAETGKPLLISTGMASVEEIQHAVDAATEVGNDQVVLLKCTSSYPARASDLNLLTIPAMRERFGCLVGLSDHTRDNVSSIVSIALGATVIEKHMTLDRAEGGVDSAFSLEPPEFAALVRECEVAWTARGHARFGASTAEEGSLQFRRSLYCVRNVAIGERFTPENVQAIRPGYGLPPSDLGSILGRRASVDITRGTALSWAHVAD
jgi:pseudaminic acid synthase